ncbi:MAG TPA: peptidase M14 [Bacteroidetes bacterium]|nr:peptidase M14 [Bacteroidota bacterium]
MKRKAVYLFLSFFLLFAPLTAQTVTTPEDFFGFKPGSDFKLAGWQRIVDYFQLIDGQSDRIQVEKLGESTQGNPFIMAIITSEKNMKNLGDYRAISRKLALAKELSSAQVKEFTAKGKTVVLVTCSIHATEVGAAQLSPELVFNLITEKDPRAKAILNNVIFLLVPSFNPDGLIMVKNWYDKYVGTPFESSRLPWLYHLYTGHDNNRDAFMLTQVESQLVTKVLYKDWFPQVYLDMHQMGNRGARIFVPPFIDPINPNVAPLVTKMNTLVGEYMATDLETKGFQGVITGTIFTSWWQGGFLLTAWWHNIPGILTELASARLAGPIFQARSDLYRNRDGSEQSYVNRVNFPDPWPGGWWRLRDILDYDYEAAMSMLEFCGFYREKFLNNVYQMAHRAIKKGGEEPPYAYVIPAQQRDPLAAVHMLDLLHQCGVEVHQAQADFEADGIPYSKNSYVVLMSQAYRAYAKDMLEAQKYPDMRQYAGGPPIQPYDVSGWTLPYQMDVKAIEVIHPFSAGLVQLDKIEYPEGKLGRGAGFGYLLDARSTDSYAGVNQALQAGHAVYRTTEPLEVQGKTFPPGSFIIGKKGSGKGKTLAQIAVENHLQFIGMGKRPAAVKSLSSVKLGVYQPWTSSMQEGWSRWVLEKYGFPYKTLHNAEIRAGDLQNRYDAVYLPDIRAEGILRGREAGTAPLEFTRGIEKEGLAHLKTFVENGGVLITMDASSELVIKYFDLQVVNIVKDVKPSEFFCPGSILNVEVNSQHPVGYGLCSTTMAPFARSSVFKIYPSFKSKAEVVVKYPRSDILKSGYLLGEKKIANQAAVVDFPVGKGHIVMIGFDAINRAQAQNTFKLFFNAIFLAGLK